MWTKVRDYRPVLRNFPLLAVLIGGLTAAALTTPAAAAEPVVGTAADGTITYRDPAAVGAATQKMTGTLEHVVVEDPNGRVSSTEYLVRQASGVVVPIEVSEELPADAAGGDVTARVAPATSQTESAEVGTLVVEPAVEAAAAGASSHRVYLAIANGVASSTSAVQSQVNEVLKDWVGDANGRISTFQIAATKRFDASCTTTSSVAWNEAAQQFPGVSFSGGTGNHLVLLGTSVADCARFGLGTVGSDISSGGLIWIAEDDDSANRLKYLRQALAHEIGHNLSLEHAGRVVCSTTTCAGSRTEYGNYYSVMGVSFANLTNTSLDTVLRDQLGILDTCEQVSVSVPAGQRTLSGTWNLSPRGSGDGTRGLKVTDPVTGDPLWIVWREGSGRDAGSFYAGALAVDKVDWPDGVTLQRRSTSSAKTDLLSIGTGAAMKPAVLSGEERTVDGVTVAVGTPTAGTIPVTLTLEAAAGAEAAPATSDEVAAAQQACDSVAPAPAPTSVPSSSAEESTGWVSTPAAKISGTVKRGRTVQAYKQTWTPTPTYYVTTWYIGGKPFTSKEKLKLSSAWKGRALTLKTVGRRDGFPTKIYWTRAGQIK